MGAPTKPPTVHYISVFRLGNSGNYKVRPGVVIVGPEDQVVMTTFGTHANARFEGAAVPLAQDTPTDLNTIVAAMRESGKGPHSYQVEIQEGTSYAEAESDPVLVIW